MLIRPKCINNFCLFHAYLGDIAIGFDTLSHLCTHIWYKLLTQCTQCQFLSDDVCELQVYTHICSAQIVLEKIYKKISVPVRGGQGARPHSWPRQEVAWKVGPPLCPPLS